MKILTKIKELLKRPFQTQYIIQYSPIEGRYEVFTRSFSRSFYMKYWRDSYRNLDDAVECVAKLRAKAKKGKVEYSVWD